MLLVACLTTASLNLYGITISGFGTGQFTVDDGLTSFTDLQSSTGLNISGSDLGNTLFGTFTPIDITGLSVLELTASVVTNPASNFNFQLFDSSFNTQTYSGNWNSFGTGVNTTISLNFLSTGAGFDPTDVQSLLITADGTGDTLNVILDEVEISAIPEPSTMTLLFLGAYALIFGRRKR